MTPDFYKDYVKIALARSINIDLTNKCILQCVYCMRQRPLGKVKIKKSSDMSFSNFKKVVKTFNTFHLCGQLSDPIYHPELIQFLQYATQNDNIIQIHTNGSGKTKQWWNKVYSIQSSSILPIRWIFGVDGIDNKTAQLHRVGQNAFSSFKAMLMGKHSNHQIAWQFIPFKHNQDQLPRARSFAKKHNIEFQILKSNRWDDKRIIINNKPIIMNWIQRPTDKSLLPAGSHTHRVVV